jgi:hypothetical protein
LETREQWQAWAADPWLPRGEAGIALPEMPPMLRRRLDPLGRLAARVAYGCWPQQALGWPVVFASRYGDATRSLEMLAELARGEMISPTAFGLSVHNAIAALVSIARGDCGNALAVAAGADSGSAALMEALALLHDGAAEVLVVCYDAPLPGDYAAFADEAPASYAWAWRVALPTGGEPRRSLSCGPLPAAAHDTAKLLPFGLDLLRWSLSSQRHWARSTGRACWSGQCHG